MVSPYSSQVLAFLQTVHGAPGPVGPEVLEASPGVVRERTVYRWQASLGDDLRFFPTFSLLSLGLVHAHLFLDGATEDWLGLPVVLSASWVNHGLERPGLYLHCALPIGTEEGFERIVRALFADGWCEGWQLLVARDGWQATGDLPSVVDRDGQLYGGAKSVPEEVLRGRRLERDVLRSLPFIVPAIFEAPEERVSLQEVWRRAFGRLGPRVWSYLPRGTRRWPVNGKRYVRNAMQRLVTAGLFRQNVIRYRPLLEHGLEIFMLLPDGGLPAVEGAIRRMCPVVEVAPGTKGRALLRVTGDERLVYELLRVAREGARPLGVWVHDHRHEAPLSRARFAYETLFDPGTGTWRFNPDEVLAGLRRTV